ncbi:MAG: hypothetical protein ACYDHY_09410 [Acidiferrobacterales bacterium]
MTRYDLACVETDAGKGAGHPFSPPAQWQGSASEYKELIRDRFKSMEYRQIFVSWSWYQRARTVAYRGPFATEAAEILEAIAERHPPPAITRQQ